MRIDRCVCHDVSFEELRRHATACGESSFRELQKKFGCGSTCGLCAPYVKCMLRTGQTVFTQIITARDESAQR